ncbi:MAG: carboxypeptidase regulatory-like domain-containing protein, partial [Candidatus Micrarchaeota archaeon]
ENTKKTLYANLRTAQDGTCDAAPVPFGATLSVIASAPGFQPKTQSVNATDDVVNVKIQLSRAVPAEETTISVVDEAGGAVAAPLVRVYDSKNALRLETAPIDGVTKVDANALGGYAGLYATIYKPGFLPTTLFSIRRGANKVVLREATQENSGTVRVVVTDKNGLPAAEVNVNLLDSAKRQLGMPGGVTSEDGSFVFDGVPASGGGVIAAAAKGGRNAQSALTQVPAGAETEITVQFAAAKTRFEARVANAVTRAAIAGATVKISAGSSGSCTTDANGKCGLEIVESDEATATVTASGFESFESSGFAIAAGANNKREFALTPQEAATGKIYFIGFFDENGKRVSELAPLAAYTARFSLSGSASRRAIAHVRVGDAATSLDDEPITLASYSASGARVTRGVSYDEIVAQQEGGLAQTQASSASSSTSSKNEIVVGIYDYGFVPQDIQAVEGARVVFKNLDAAQHTVVFDQGFEGGAGSTSNVLQSNQTFIVTPSRAGSWSFRCGLHPQEMGTLNVVPSTQSAEEEARAAASGTLLGSQATAFKWVEFSFEPFTGRREISVSFKTRQRVGEKAWLEYRAAFYGETSITSVESNVLREPVDEAAGTSKPEALAEAKKTASLAIKFGGTCEQNVCLEYWFEREGVREKDAFTAELGKTFRLGFHALKEGDAPATLRLRVPLSAAAGGAIELKQATLGNRVAGSAAGEANASEIAVVLRDADSTGFFEAEARRLSNDAEVRIAVLDSKRNTLLEENAFLRVAAQGTPRLVVSFKPASLTALEAKTIVFTIKNAFGTPITDARVTLEPASGFDAIIASTLETDENADSAKRGEYKVAGVSPAGMGALEWRASAEGYADASGVIEVKQPAEAIAITPESVKLGLSGSQDTAEATITVTNKVSNDLRVVVSSEFSKPSNYVLLIVSPETMRLRGGETQEVTIVAALSPDAPLVAKIQQTLTERAVGALHFVATTGDAAGSGMRGTLGESHDVAFQVDASVAQKKLDDLWSVDKRAVELSQQAPSTPSTLSQSGSATAEATEEEFTAQAEEESKTITIENKGDFALAINQEVDVDGVIVDPLSTVIEAGDSADFTLTPLLPDSLPPCLAKDYSQEGTVTFYASRLGVASQKTVALKKTVKASENCEPDNSVAVTLPVSLTLDLPSASQTKENADGSRALILSNGVILWFDAGSNADSRSITLPLNTQMKLPPAMASVTQQGVTLSLPTQSTVEIPDDADVAQQDATLVVSAGNAIIYLPAGVSLSAYQNQRAAIVPPNTQIRFERAPIADILGSLPTGGISLNLPVQEVLVLPTSARIVQSSGSQTNAGAAGVYGAFGFGGTQSGYAALSRYQNVNSIVLPDGLRIAFGGDARVERTLAAIVVTIPPNGQFVVPPSFVMPLAFAAAGSASATTVGATGSSETFEAFALSMPFLSMPGIPKGAKLVPDPKKGLYSYVLSDDSAVQFTFDPRLSATQVGSLTQVRVAPLAPVSFLKGASATAIEDPTQTCAAPEIFVADEDVIIDFPSGTVFQKSPFKAITHDCSSDSKIRVYSKKNSDVVLYESPASKRVEIEGGKLAGDGGSGSGADSESTTIATAAAGKKIKFYYCEKDDDGKKASVELKMASITLLGATTLVLPPSAKAEAGLTEIKLGGYKKIKLVNSQKDVGELSATDKIRLEFGSGADAMIAKQKDAFEKGETNAIYLPPRSVIKYVPYCGKSASGSLEVQVGGLSMAFDPAELKFDALTNANSKQTKEICIKNLGLEKISINDISVEPAAGSEALAEALPSDSEHMHFTKPYGGMHIGEIPGGEKCAKYSFTAEAPYSILDSQGCIPEGYDATLKGFVSFYATDERGRKSQPVKLAATVQINGKDLKDKCAGFVSPENAKNLLDASVAEIGPDQQSIYFKGVGGEHEQFLTLKNNWREEVEVKVVKDAGYADCRAYDYVTRVSQQGLAGTKLPAGSAIVFKCVSSVSKGAGTGQLLLNFTSTEGKWYKEFPITVTVFEPDASVASLYTHSPMGKVLVTEDTLKGLGDQTPADSKVTQSGAGVVSETGEASFADAASDEPKEFPSCLQFAEDPKTTPEEPKVVTSFSLCELQFCAGVDAVQKLDSFIADTAALAIYETKNPTMYEKIRARLGQVPSKPWQKVFALHLTNTAMTSEQLLKQITDNVKKRSDELKKEGFKRGIIFKDKDAAKQLTGCGIYVFTAKLDAGGFSVASEKPYEERVKDYALDLSVEKMADCEETIANLPLLLSPDDVDFFSGNKIQAHGGNFRDIGTFTDRWAHLKRAFIGVYYDENNEFDLKQASALSIALHGIERTNPKTGTGGVYPSSFYEDVGQCWSNLGASRLSLAISYSAAVSGLIAWSVLKRDPSPIRAFAQAFASVFLAPCGVNVIAQSIRGGSGCAQLDFCMHMAMVALAQGTVDGIYAGGWGGRSTFGKLEKTAEGTTRTTTSFWDATTWKNAMWDAASYSTFVVGMAVFGKDADPRIVYVGGKAINIARGAIQAARAAKIKATEDAAATTAQTPEQTTPQQPPRVAPEPLVPVEKGITGEFNQLRSDPVAFAKWAKTDPTGLVKKNVWVQIKSGNSIISQAAIVDARAFKTPIAGGLTKTVAQVKLLQVDGTMTWKTAQAVGTTAQKAGTNFVWELVKNYANIATPAAQTRDLSFAGSSATQPLLLPSLLSSPLSSSQAPLQALAVRAPSASSDSTALSFADPTTAEQDAAQPKKEVNLGKLAMFGLPVALTGFMVLPKLIKAAKSGKGIFAGLGTSLANQGPGAAAGLLVLFAFRVEGKPVRAEFNNVFASHVLAFHYEGGTPTTRAYCYLSSKEKDKYGESKNCLSQMDVSDASTLCPKENDACLFAKLSPKDVPNTPQEAGVPGYTAVLVVNNEKFNTRDVFKSIFQPEIPPVSEKDGSKTIAKWSDEIGGTPPESSDAEREAVQADYSTFAG